MPISLMMERLKAWGRDGKKLDTDQWLTLFSKKGVYLYVSVHYSVGLDITKMKFEPVPILSFNWMALGEYPLSFSTFWLCLK